MTIFHSMNVSASALTAQRMRMDTISSNIANAETTRATIGADGEWLPYRRKSVVFEPRGSSFHSYLQQARGNSASPDKGVRVTEIREDDAPFRMEYNPNHPDADENGYVAMPNVDPLREMVDLMSATRSYEANVTAMNATKSILLKALEIGK
ncbi:flagellar basal body rod protein FlgC [Thalassobacillus pellis]|uniref:flagellar basal body rod protein FlgC n=1 Tax=Thalassobacillus pellis TaxID=748008 RepID=UPI00195F5960|nr:flagellar basal body rod protein FlgC [Thalassobacillus pellis]MBM7552755.1 flagellar basal-body rod protein FlgC [Thalassobacillus pellis]